VCVYVCVCARASDDCRFGLIDNRVRENVCVCVSECVCVFLCVYVCL